MTTPQLPPEIKSAEEWATLALRTTFRKDFESLIKQIQLDAWNAAIEKAADSIDLTIPSSPAARKQAILNLKLK